MHKGIHTLELSVGISTCLLYSIACDTILNEEDVK